MYPSIIIATIIIAIYMTSIFIVSLIKKDNSIVDTAYGIGFILISISTAIIFSPISFPAAIVTFLITIWAIRLSTRIFLRNYKKPEDFRYKAWRDSWTWFKTRSFFQIYMLQGSIILAIASPALFLNGLGSSIAQPSIILVSIGVCIWIIGFFFEAVGDHQLDQFIRQLKQSQTNDNTPHRTIMDQGLWSLTRHPNYFGEVCIWWGIWVIALSVYSSNMSVLFTFISPLLITFLLLKVSGIPMLEEKYKGNKEFDEYKKRTNAFFPWKK